MEFNARLTQSDSEYAAAMNYESLNKHPPKNLYPAEPTAATTQLRATKIKELPPTRKSAVVGKSIPPGKSTRFVDSQLG
jgi:hypothetical protein